MKASAVYSESFQLIEVLVIDAIDCRVVTAKYFSPPMWKWKPFGKVVVLYNVGWEIPPFLPYLAFEMEMWASQDV